MNIEYIKECVETLRTLDKRIAENEKAIKWLKERPKAVVSSIKFTSAGQKKNLETMCLTLGMNTESAVGDILEMMVRINNEAKVHRDELIRLLEGR